MRTREEALDLILGRHGPNAVYVAATGFTSRAVGQRVTADHCVFYMQGSMGLAPAIGLGVALARDVDVVVINGDASLLMSMGTTHTIRDAARPRLYHYVLDNGCHESVGGQPAATLELDYPGVTEIISITRGGKPPRVAVEPAENARRVSEFLDRQPRASAAVG